MLPTLYSKNANGSVQQWSVSVDKNVVTVSYGQVGGLIQAIPDVVKKGKNLGKANATTAEEQAVLKAKQLWDKKIKENYLTDLARAEAGETDLKGSLPMLAYDYPDKVKYAKYPGLAQPKLDGFRCTAEIVNGKVTLYSRTRKEIKSVPHINEQIESLKFPDMTLDGELYNHAFKDDFSRLASLIKRDELHPDRFHVQFHIYDNMNPGTWSERNDPIRYVLESTEHLKPVETRVVNSEAELFKLFEQWIIEGYEGAMYRMSEVCYGYEGDKENRSVGLLKVKVYEDYEFEIIGMEEGEGKLMGMAATFIFRNCLNPSSDRDAKLNISKWRDSFKSTIVRLRKPGIDNPSKESDYAETKEEFANRRKEYMNNIQNYIGKFMTVQFQGRSKYYGVPRFPVSLRIKEEL